LFKTINNKKASNYAGLQHKTGREKTINVLRGAFVGTA
jgi:hypothetical protein